MTGQLNLGRDIFKIAKVGDEGLFQLKSAGNAADGRNAGCANDGDS